MLETITETRMSTNLALIALGANLSSSVGSPDQSVRFALQLISRHPDLTLGSVSKIYYSPAFPAGSGPDYANACACLHTALSPEALLHVLHEIEAELGRQRDGRRWAARGIDLDLLAMGRLVLPDHATQDAWRSLPLAEQMTRTPEQLILPHPRMQDRAFVLLPLAEIAPLWRHPRSGQTVAEMLAALPAEDRAALRVSLDNPPATHQVTVSALSDSNR